MKGRVEMLKLLKIFTAKSLLCFTKFRHSCNGGLGENGGDRCWCQLSNGNHLNPPGGRRVGGREERLQERLASVSSLKVFYKCLKLEHD